MAGIVIAISPKVELYIVFIPALYILIFHGIFLSKLSTISIPIPDPMTPPYNVVNAAGPSVEPALPCGPFAGVYFAF